MSVYVLPLDFLTTFVLTVDDLEQASLIVRMKVLIDDDCIALLMWTVDSSKVAGKLMALHLLSL